MTLPTRFWVKVEERDECLVWTGALNDAGYGVYRTDGGRAASKTVLAHRAVWEDVNGPIPDGMELDHVRKRGCKHRACVKLQHLEVVTRRENQRRGDGPGGLNFRKQVCLRNHPFDYVDVRGRRVCRRCRNLRKARIRER